MIKMIKISGFWSRDFREIFRGPEKGRGNPKAGPYRKNGG
jgi:hypothetical protein